MVSVYWDTTNSGQSRPGSNGHEKGTSHLLVLSLGPIELSIWVGLYSFLFFSFECFILFCLNSILVNNISKFNNEVPLQ